MMITRVNDDYQVVKIMPNWLQKVLTSSGANATLTGHQFYMSLYHQRFVVHWTASQTLLYTILLLLLSATQWHQNRFIVGAD